MGKWGWRTEKRTISKNRKLVPFKFSDLNRVGKKTSKKRIRCPSCNTLGRRKSSKRCEFFSLYDDLIFYSCPNDECPQTTFKTKTL